MYRRAHGKPSLDNDIKELMNTLVQNKVFDHIPGRAFTAFPGFIHYTGVTDILKFKKCVLHHQHMTALERDIALNI